MSNWLTNITTSEGVTGFLKNIESKLDQVLDVAPVSVENKQDLSNTPNHVISELPVKQVQDDFFKSFFGTPSTNTNINTIINTNHVKKEKIGNFKDKLDSIKSKKKTDSPNLNVYASDSTLPTTSSTTHTVEKQNVVQESCIELQENVTETVAENVSEIVTQLGTQLGTENETATIPESIQDQTQETLQEIHTQHILQQRESRLVQVMQENASLNESLLFYKSSQDEKQSFISSLQDQVKDLSEQLSLLNKDSSSTKIQELKSIVKEKDVEISELRREGERLSKLELKNNSSLKKLVSMKSESEKTVKELEKRIEAVSQENTDLKSKLIKSTDLEKRQSESIKSLSNSNVTLQKEFERISQEHASYLLQYQELSQTHTSTLVEYKKMQDQDSESRLLELQEILKSEKTKSLELESQILQLSSTLSNVESEYRKQVLNLRSELQRSEEEKGWKEDLHRKECSALQNRILEADARQEELSMMSHESTKPLLRQIEALQTQYQNACQEWSLFEVNMNKRIMEADQIKLKAIEKERHLMQENQELKMNIKQLESELDLNSRSKAELNVELNNLKSKLNKKQQEYYNLKAQFDSNISKHQGEIQELKTKFQIELENCIKQEQEKYKLVQQEEMQSLVEDRVLQLQSQSLSQERQSSSQGGEKKSSIPFEKYITTIKQLESQVSSLTLQLQLATKTRDDLAGELFKLSTENEDLKKISNQISEWQDKYKDLETRYQASLELVGEKTERIEDLTADIQEMRSVYQSQLEELLAGSSQ